MRKTTRSAKTFCRKKSPIKHIIKAKAGAKKKPQPKANAGAKKTECLRKGPTAKKKTSPEGS